METATVTLADFLLARIAEDEEVARAAASITSPRWAAVDGGVEADGEQNDPDDLGVIVYDEGRPTASEAAHIARHDPARVLAECEAKRELAKRHRPTDERNRWCSYCAGTDNAEYPCETSRLLALPYADHPDYRDEWRP